jgi:hypothetical protein
MERRLILLTILGLAASDQAQADPGKKQASPCPSGFAALQNSDTCVRISGRVRADALAGSPRARMSNGFETRTSGRVQLDVRKQTEYGPLRAVIRVDGVAR